MRDHGARGTAAHGYDLGHMRHQLEQTLTNMRTDYLDIYFFHHAEFGENDRWLDGAVQAMHQFRDEGLVRAVGMRGPHRFALDRLDATRPRPASSARAITAAASAGLPHPRWPCSPTA
jgi:methylglyoxal reductase